MYSWLAVTNPRLAMHWYGVCKRDDWNEAMRIQQLVNLYKVHVKSKWRGKCDAAVNKADAVMNSNIHCDLRVRAPYASCVIEDIEQARKWAKENFPELLEI